MADLTRWAFASFHAAVLVVVAVWLLHLSAALGGLLGGLDTALGLALYGVLWGLVWWATGRAFDAAAPTERSLRARAWAGFQYGALTGVGFLLVVLVGATVALLVTGGALVPVAVVSVVGSMVAVVLGGLVGVVFAAADAPLARVGERLVPGEG